MSCAQSKYATQDTPAPSVTNSSAHKKYAMNINQNEGNPRLYASDNIISRDFKLTDFKRIHLSSYGNIRYEYSRQPRVSIRTSDNVFDVVTVKVENETLTLDMPTTSNVIQYFTEDKTKISIRPSGTEPKIKFYCEVHSKIDSVDEIPAAEKAAAEKIEAIKASLGI